MSSIFICGHFANGKESYDGQTIKTKNVYKELVKKYGENKIIKTDTYFIKKRPLFFFKELKKNFKKSDNIIILPAQRGLKVLVPYLNHLNKNKDHKIHYVVIGGWLPNLIEKNNFLKNQLKKIDYIYVETKNTIEKLNNMGLDNVCQLNNFKELTVSEKKYNCDFSNFRCCIFSRIEYLKGINDAIEVVNSINKNSNRKIFLDLYGKVKDEYLNEFQIKLLDNKYISYKGVVNSNSSVKVIEKYDLLLFPTLYYTEGIPGTIIDSYFAGVPILSSRWENFDNVIEENITGISYKFKDVKDFQNKMIDILNEKYNLKEMSNSCKKTALKYLPDNSMQILYENLGDKNVN